MDSFDKKVSDIFNTESHGEVPAEFSWSEMNACIYEKIDNQKSKRRPIIWFCFVGIFSIIVFAHYNWNYNSQDTNNKKDTTLIASTKSLLETPISRTVQNNAELNQNSKNVTYELNKLITSRENEQIQSEKNKINYPNGNESIIHQTSKKISTNLNSDSSEESLKNEFANFKIGQKSVYTDYAKKIISSDDKRPLSSILSISKGIEPIIKKTLKQNLKTSKDNEVQIQYLTQLKYNRPITTSLYSGTLLGYGSYKGVTDRQLSSKWLPGYYVGIQFNLFQNYSYTFYSGIEHKFAVQLFEINSTKDITVPVLNALVHTETNALTGQKTNTHADTTGISSVTHSYTNYNTFRSNALNIGIQKTIKLGRLSLGLTAGASYSFLILSKGKTIGNDHNIIDYNSSMPIYRKDNWSIQSGVEIDLEVNTLLSLNIHARGDYSLNNWTTEKEISLIPSFVKLGGGMTFRF